MEGKFIKLINIYKTYKTDIQQNNILSGINLDINKGEIIVIAGPSGSGKTTLLNLMGGLDYPDRGSICINKKEIQNMNEKQLTDFRRKEIGLIFQDDALIPEMTVFENLELPLVLVGNDRKTRKEKIENILSSLKLKDKKDSYPGELSGGEKQRIAAARAIIHNPSLILADEPTANLDRDSSIVVIDTIKNISENLNITVVITTHDQNIIDKIGKTVFLDYGEIRK